MNKIIHTLYSIEAPTNLVNQYTNIASLEWKRHPIKSEVLILRDEDGDYINDIAEVLKHKGIPFTKGSL